MYISIYVYLYSYIYICVCVNISILCVFVTGSIHLENTYSHEHEPCHAYAISSHKCFKRIRDIFDSLFTSAGHIY